MQRNDPMTLMVSSMTIGAAIFGVPIFAILAALCFAIAYYQKSGSGIGRVMMLGCSAVIGILIILIFVLIALLNSGW